MPAFPNYVRVKDKSTGVKHSVITDDDHPIDPAAYDVLKQDATDESGRPLPAEFPESLSSNSGQKADTKKETS
jgi:hypothetical protein